MHADPDQRADELKKRCEGVFTDSELRRMSPEVLANELRKRAGRIREDVLIAMETSKLRRVLKLRPPDEYR